MTKLSPIELWADGAMIGRGAAALEPLPDTPAQHERLTNMLRVEARAVDAEARRADAEQARDQALEEQKLAQTIVDAARASLISQLCERCDALGQRMDAFARARARAHLDSLPDPDNANADPGGELHQHGPVGQAHLTAGDQIPDPKRSQRHNA